MKVSPINNYQQNFNGKVDKSLKKFITYGIRNEAKIMAGEASSRGEAINAESIIEMRISAEKTIEKFVKYAEQLHDKTVFKIRNRYGSPVFSIQNSFLKTKIEGYNSVQKGKNEEWIRPIDTGCFRNISSMADVYKKVRFQDVMQLDKYINALSKISPKEIEDELLKKAIEKIKTLALDTTWYGQLRTLYKGYRTLKYTKTSECQIDPIKIAKREIADAKADKALRKLNNKKAEGLVKENSDKIEELLK